VAVGTCLGVGKHIKLIMHSATTQCNALLQGWLLVYSVDEKRSFTVLQEIYDKLAVSVNNPPVVVVGNKTDLDARSMSHLCFVAATFCGVCNGDFSV
jgi:hypothetical protein